MKIGALRRGEVDVELSKFVHPATEDIVVDKPRYSALIGTDLAGILSKASIGRVVIGGVTTSMCVESTARDLAQRDFEVAVIEEACGDFDAARHTASLSALAFGFARVLPLRAASESVWQCQIRNDRLRSTNLPGHRCAARFRARICAVPLA